MFLAILKDGSLKWFMGIRTHSIRTQYEMKRVFLEKYKDCFMHRNLKDEVFKIVQREDENLEDMVERFAYNIKGLKYKI